MEAKADCRGRGGPDHSGGGRRGRRGGGGRRRLALAAASTAVLVLTVVAPATVAVAATRPTTPAVALAGRASKLAPRLQTLLQPQVRALTGAGQSRALGLAASGAGSLMQRPGGRVVVRIRFADTSTATLDAVRAAGVTDLSVSVPDAVANGVVAPSDLAAVAQVPGVASVQEEITPLVGPPSSTPGPASAPPPAVTSAGACPSGIVSEGDAQLKANTARANFGVDGTGVNVGVLSDSFNSLGGAATDVAANELPGPANTCGNTTPVIVQADQAGTDEGRAMAQIVHDLAPGASLTFATAMNGAADFANQIRTLKNNGASVIVDDVTYFQEPMFQDGVIAKAVDDVVAQGATYYSSAANNTVTIGGHDVTSYETAAFRATPCPTAVVTFEGAGTQCHNFSQSGTDAGDTITVNAGKTIRLALSWNQPQGGVTTDLDLLLVDTATGAIQTSSFVSNAGTDGSQDPSEFFSFTNASGSTHSYRMVVARYQGVGGGDGGTPRFKIVNFLNGDTSVLGSVQYNTTAGNDVVGPTLLGHNGATRAATVAAVPYNNAAVVEPYSSHGPARKCWGPTTGVVPSPTMTPHPWYQPPASPLSPCQSKTVDFAATDGGANSFFGGFSAGAFRFFGTSAAAPHAAAVGALARQKYPCRTPDEILAAQRASAVPLAYPVDVAGAGLVDANAMLGAITPCPASLFHPVTPVRVLDSRPATKVGSFSTPWVGGTSRDVAIGGVSGIPANVDAVVLNVTVTNTTGSSFLTLWPTGQTRPTASSLNWTPGRTIPNAVTVRVGTGGKVSVFNNWRQRRCRHRRGRLLRPGGGPGGDGFTSQAPARIVDSRPATKVGDFASPWTAGMARDVVVGDRGGVPADADAVVLNVTVTNTTGSSFLTLWPSGQTPPTASNLNWTPGLTIPNAVTVKLGAAGKVSVYNLTGDVDVVIDVAGYYTGGDRQGVPRPQPRSGPRLAARLAGGRLFDAVGRRRPHHHHRRSRGCAHQRRLRGAEHHGDQHHRVVLPHRVARGRGPTDGLEPQLDRRGDHPQRGDGQVGHRRHGLHLQPLGQRRRRHRRGRMVRLTLR